MKEFQIVSPDNLHDTIRTFIVQRDFIIGDYEDMKDAILTMIKAGYMFNMDRDRLRDAMEDITYMLCPSDDANKDRVERGLEYDDDDDDGGYSSSDSDEDSRRSDHRKPKQGSADKAEYIISGDSGGSIVIEDIGDVKDIPDVS